MEGQTTLWISCTVLLWNVLLEDYYWSSFYRHSGIVMLHSKRETIKYLIYFALPFLLYLLFEDSSYWQHLRRQQLSSWENSLSAPSELNLQEISRSHKSLERQNHGNGKLIIIKHHNRIQRLLSTHMIYRDCRSEQSQKEIQQTHRTNGERRKGTETERQID